MEKELFLLGIEDLRSFHKFAPSQNQLISWYRRLKHYSDDAWRIAVHNLTESTGAIGYKKIKNYLYTAQGRMDKEMKIPMVQGIAPRTPTSRAFMKDCFSELLRVMNEPDLDKRKDQLTELKNIWATGFQQLPELITEHQIRDSLNARDYDFLLRIGFMKEIPEKQFVPMLESEKQRNAGDNLVKADFQRTKDDF